MKPCRINRTRIASLALGHLEQARAAALQEHLETCEGCRSYLDELKAITAAARATGLETDVQTTAFFHQRVVARVKAEEHAPAKETFKEFARAVRLSWRVAAPVAVGLAVVLAIWVFSTPRPHNRPSVTPAVTPNAAARFDSNLEPTLANYQAIANQSLDDLDQLLNDQGRKNLPPVPTYTASTFAMAGKPD